LAYAQSGGLTTHIGFKEGFPPSTVYAIIKDHKGFMWYGSSDGLWKFDGYRHTVYRHDPKNKNSLSANFIRCLQEDSKGNIWVGTLSNGLNKFDPVTNSFRRYIHDQTDSASLLSNEVSSVTEDPEGNIWVTAGKLSLMKKDQSGFDHFDDMEIDQWGPTKVFSDRSGTLWVGSNADGFSRFDPKSKSFKNYRVDHADPTIRVRSNVVRAFSDDGHDNLWIGTYGGLLKFNKQTEKITHWVHDDAKETSLGHNSIWGLVATKEKVWISTWGGGISCLDARSGLFENSAFRQGGIYGLTAQEFPCIYLESSGTFWIGSNAMGIFKIKPISASPLPMSEGILGKNFREVVKGKRLTYFISTDHQLLAWSAEKGVELTLYPQKENRPTSLSGNRIASVSESQSGTIYVGTDFGLTSYNPVTKKIIHFVNDPQDTATLVHNSILTTFVDSTDRLWVGTPYGLNLFIPKTGKFMRWRSPILSTNSVASLAESSDGIWIGTGTAGLRLLDVAKRRSKSFIHDEKNDSSLSGSYVRSIFVDSSKNLWLGISDVLNKFNPSTESFLHYKLNGTIHTLSEGKKHNLLIETTEALFEMSDPDASNGPIFKKKKVLRGESNVFWSPQENRLYLLFEKSIFTLPFDSLKENQVIPPIGITMFNLDPNNKHPLDSAEAQRSPSHRKEITLDHDQNLFSIEFSALDFTDPAYNEYAYKLEGFDEDWTYSGTRRFVTYTNLGPGDYTFRAKGSNNEGVWNEEGTSLKIYILPPPWKTWWAYTGYGFIFVGLLLIGRRITVNRERLKAQVVVEQKEKQAMRELDHLKTKFFSNITHEFRTPLTLIQGPADELLEKTQDSEARTLIGLIKSNSNRLLKLINQLLDLAKLDAREMKFNPTPVSLGSLVTVTISQFTSLAASKGITYKWQVGETLPAAQADTEKLETILSNLISNAMKFTPAGGSVEVQATWRDPHFMLLVRDTGRGIPADKLPHIFDRFYQVNPTDASHSEGTGIGLALVKEYTELMKGILEVESKVGSGTTFVIKLPLTPIDLPAEALESRLGPTNGSPLVKPGVEENGQLPLVLLVEDNADLRSFIRTCLGNEFRYSEAGNGREGMELAMDLVPDLIVSDLMMPEMDGIELCARLKKDRRTDHIPFIMLTAKAAEENKLEGLQTGADDYLVKPFNKAELLLKVQNLITLRMNLQTHIRTAILARASDVKAVSAEEQFVLKARLFVETHIKDESLSVETLSAEMNLSREQCYRKISALTGLAPSAFIRKIKLQRAHQLLSSKWGAVSQVAYEAGFENLSYFSKAFKEEFGKLPSEV